MAAFTSKAAGSVLVGGQTSWNEVGVPGDGDTVSMTHAMTMPDNWTVGHSPASGHGTPAIAISGSGGLVATAAKTLRCRGDFNHDGELVDFVGAHFLFDPSAAGTPSASAYVGRIGITASVYTQRFRIGDGSTVSTDLTGGGARGRFMRQASGAGGGRWEALTGGNRCFISHLGSTTLPCLIAKAEHAIYSADVGFVNVDFDDCGILDYSATNFSDSYDFTLQDCTFRNRLHATDDTLLDVDNTSTGGDRIIDHCGFEGRCNIVKAIDILFTDNIFAGGVSMAVGGTSIWRTNAWNMAATTFDINAREVTDGLVYSDYAGGSGGFGIRSAGAFDVTVDGLIFDQSELSGGGANWIFPNITNGQFVIARNCIITVGNDGVPSGTLMSFTLTTQKFKAYHNTIPTVGTGESGLSIFCETYDGAANQIPEAKGNLYFTPAGKAQGIKARRSLGAGTNTTVSDVATPGGWDYNAAFNLAAGNQGNGFEDADTDSANPMFSVATSTMDTNGITDDPEFVDPTRNVCTWDDANGGGGTIANAQAEMLKLNDADFDTDYSLDSFITYTRAGYTPTNSAYDGASHDATTPGAVEGNFSGPAVNFSAQPITQLLLGVC